MVDRNVVQRNRQGRKRHRHRPDPQTAGGPWSNCTLARGSPAVAHETRHRPLESAVVAIPCPADFSLINQPARTTIHHRFATSLIGTAQRRFVGFAASLVDQW